MRIAVVSDIHGNLTALEAVLDDLRAQSPDLVVHGGDIAEGGARPAAVLDRVRALGWRGVLGNGDEMLFRPEALERFAGQSKAPSSMWDAVRENAAATRAALGLAVEANALHAEAGAGAARLAWLRGLPAELREGDVAVVHARPGDCWRAPGIDGEEAALAEAYGGLGAAVAVYGHTHVPGVRRLRSGLVVVNAGSVGLPFDGDARASYAVVETGETARASAEIRRVAYDVEAEIRALEPCGLPGAAWTARMLRAGAAVMMEGSEGSSAPSLPDS